MRPTVFLLALGAGLGASPSQAQGVPPNPFASNYPSAPPAVERGERIRVPKARRRPPPRRVEREPAPPADIPSR